MKIGYEFFNCNLMKSTGSMSALCSEEVYTDTKAGRHALLSHVMLELDSGGVEIESQDLDKVRKSILLDNPMSANELIKYGIILSRSIY